MSEHRVRAGDADRDQTIGVLRSAYEAGRLDHVEWAERQEAALTARFLDDLSALTSDLPEAGLVPRAPAPLTMAPERPAVAPRKGGFTLSVMSGRKVRVDGGVERVSGFAWWGGSTFVLDDAVGPGRVVILNLSAIMGGYEVFVPEGVRVVDETAAIMAGADVSPDADGDGSNGTVVLRGFLFWAGITVTRSRH